MNQPLDLGQPYPEIPAQWIAMAKYHGGYLAGGCLRDLLLGKPVNDVDIFIPGLREEECGEDGWEDYAWGFQFKSFEQDGQVYQLIRHRFDHDLANVLDHFDVGICKIGYNPWSEQWIVHQDFFHDIAHKKLTVHLVNWRHENHLAKLVKKFPDYEVVDTVSNEDWLFA